MIGGLKVFLLADDHESKSFRTFKVECTSCSHSNTAPLAPISSAVFKVFTNELQETCGSKFIKLCSCGNPTAYCMQTINRKFKGSAPVRRTHGPNCLPLN